MKAWVKKDLILPELKDITNFVQKLILFSLHCNYNYLGLEAKKCHFSKNLNYEKFYFLSFGGSPTKFFLLKNGLIGLVTSMIKKLLPFEPKKIAFKMIYRHFTLRGELDAPLPGRGLRTRPIHLTIYWVKMWLILTQHQNRVKKLIFSKYQKTYMFDNNVIKFINFHIVFTNKTKLDQQIPLS